MINSTKVRDQAMLSLKKSIVLAGAILLCVQATYADVIYRETFSRTAGAPNTNFSYVGWSGYWSATAQPGDGVTVPYNNFGSGSSVGIPSGGNITNAFNSIGSSIGS